MANPLEVLLVGGGAFLTGVNRGKREKELRQLQEKETEQKARQQAFIQLTEQFSQFAQHFPIDELIGAHQRGMKAIQDGIFNSDFLEGLTPLKKPRISTSERLRQEAYLQGVCFYYRCPEGRAGR